MTQAAPLQIQNLGVKYGRIHVLHDISIKVEPGQVYALLGRNGSGKTSLVRCLLGWQRPSEGQAWLFGEAAWTCRHRAMERIGVVQESPEIPGGLRVDQALHFCSRLAAHWDSAGVAGRLDRAGISQKAMTATLSKGQKAQLALAIALGQGPELLILDDPTLGLDAVARRAFFETLVTELADRGVTVLLTTHDLVGVEGVADRIGILKGGRLLLDEPVEALKASIRRVRLRSGPEAGSVLKGLQVLRVTHHPWGNEALVAGLDEGSLQRLGQASAELESLDLEGLFIALVDERSEVRA